MTAHDFWWTPGTLMSTGPGANGCHTVLITCAAERAAHSIHDHIVASFNASHHVVEHAGYSAEVADGLVVIREVDDGPIALLKPAEARALAAVLLKLADEATNGHIWDHVWDHVDG